MSGTLTARRVGERIELNFPADTPTPLEGAAGDKVIGAHKAACPELREAEKLDAFQTAWGTILLVQLGPDQRLRDLRYDPSALVRALVSSTDYIRR
jgi:hypothetical protein